MNGTILLAVDHSKNSERAAETAAELARTGKNPVVVLHVHAVAVGRFGKIMIEAEPESGCIAEVIAGELIAAGIEARHENVEAMPGRVAARIAQMADNLDAALIVLGTHGASDLTSITLGSVSHRVLHLARRPMLVVPLP